MKRLQLARASVLALLIMLVSALSLAAAGPVFVDWTVPGAPQNIAAQSPSTAWATVPAKNAILRVQFSSQGAASGTLFTVPTANAEPYNIAVGGSWVWFTERLGNKIGRLNAATGTIDEFPIPRAASEPTGVAVLPGTPDRVWFTERAGNALGLLTVTDTVKFSFTEYPLPWTNARPEDVAAADAGSIWFTAPGVGRLGLFKPALWPDSSAFYGPGTGPGSQPWAVTVLAGAAGDPWLTERQGNRVGIYAPQTYADFRWWTAPTAASDPYDIALFGELTGFVERAANRATLLNRRTGSIREFAIPGSAPTSIAFDANGCAWIAESGASKVGRWCAPYFGTSVYLPLVRR